MFTLALCLTASLSASAAAGHLRSNTNMQPEQVAAILMSVQNEWKAQAHIVTECGAKDEFTNNLPTCKEALTAFQHSCIKVASAIMVSSNTPSDATEYMTDVCSQSLLSPWHQAKCNIVSAAITSKMSDNVADNRQDYFEHAKQACNGVWSRFMEEQQKLHTPEIKQVPGKTEMDAKKDEEEVHRVALKSQTAKQNHVQQKASNVPNSKTTASKQVFNEEVAGKLTKNMQKAKKQGKEDLEIIVAPPPASAAAGKAAPANAAGKNDKKVPPAPKEAAITKSSPSKISPNVRQGVAFLQTVHTEAPADMLAKEMTHDLELNFNRIAPFGKEDTAKELQDHASKTQDTLVDAVENAEVAEIKRAVFRALTRLRAATIKEFDTIARLETQAIDAYNDAHHFRAENPLAHLHEDEAPVSTDKLKSFH